MHKVDVYTDGSCLGNPGPGGWGAVIVEGDKKTIFSGSDPDTTNNRMELAAAVAGLERLPALNHSVDITIYSDSRYVLDGITKWIKGWKKNNWKTASRQPVKNADLWKRLHVLVFEREARGRPLVWKWVKGHSGDPMNELADKVARDAAYAAGTDVAVHPPVANPAVDAPIDMFSCDSCGHLYHEAVSSCDCMPDKNSFTPYVAVTKEEWLRLTSKSENVKNGA